MKKWLVKIFSISSLIFFTSVPAKSGDLVLLSDEELDGIYAQGLNIVAGAVSDIVDSTLGSVVQAIPLDGFVNLNGSVLITDNAQNGAWNPVNAANSAVNNSYNIFIIIESELVNPEFNINTILDAINGSTLGGTVQ